MPAQGFQELFVQSLLTGEGAFPCAQDFVLEGLQLWRYESFGTFQRLAARVFRRCLVGLGATDLDVVAVYPVIAQSKRRYAGTFAFAPFHLHEELARILAEGAQLIEPYVDEEVSWAIRMHQVLRFFPDESVGYEYPEAYVKMFGEDFVPEPYVVAEYERAKKHKWYMSARMICLNDLYSFDPDVQVELEAFEDIIGRHFRQPEEGLGNDNTPSSHMWRTLRRPCNAL